MTRALLAGLLALALSACGDADGELDFRGKNLLLISVDTLRADRLGCYGYERGTSPALDALAEESVLFEEMYSNSPKTASSHMSLFTSMLPSAHKVRNQSARLGLVSPTLAKNRKTLPQLLNRAGYFTAGVAGGGNLIPEMGFMRGFMGRFSSSMEDVDRLVDRTIQRIAEGHHSNRPMFIFLHTYQVHGPYLPPREYLDRFVTGSNEVLTPRVETYVDMPFQQQWAYMNKGKVPFWGGREDFGQAEADYMSDLYDGEVAYTDAQLGRLLESLRNRKELDDWIIVVLSDHGEEFYEHGDFEHDQLHREVLHVPCLIRLPGGALGGTRVRGLTSLIDVAPTLCELLGLEAPETFSGQSLVPAMRSGRTAGEPIVAERVMFPEDYRAALRGPSSQVTFRAADGTLEAFDLAADPDELEDVYSTAPFAAEAADRLRFELARIFQLRESLDQEDAGGELTLDSAERVAELQGLGYVGGSEQGLEAPEGTPLERWPTDG